MKSPIFSNKIYPTSNPHAQYKEECWLVFYKNSQISILSPHSFLYNLKTKPNKWLNTWQFMYWSKYHYCFLDALGRTKLGVPQFMSFINNPNERKKAHCIPLSDESCRCIWMFCAGQNILFCSVQLPQHPMVVHMDHQCQ